METINADANMRKPATQASTLLTKPIQVLSIDFIDRPAASHASVLRIQAPRESLIIRK
ncbi:hypothetical protein [Castellaniella sp.]|uniref:hypothetical protein n=1 Tax=Castellaniella sp. TaxID=1955812 RepID=UPI0035627042